MFKLKPAFTAKNAIILITVLPFRVTALSILWFISWVGELATVAAGYVSQKLPGLELDKYSEESREVRLKRIAGLRKVSQKHKGTDI